MSEAKDKSKPSVGPVEYVRWLFEPLDRLAVLVHRGDHRHAGGEMAHRLPQLRRRHIWGRRHTWG